MYLSSAITISYSLWLICTVLTKDNSILFLYRAFFNVQIMNKYFSIKVWFRPTSWAGWGSLGLRWRWPRWRRRKSWTQSSASKWTERKTPRSNRKAYSQISLASRSVDLFVSSTEKPISLGKSSCDSKESLHITKLKVQNEQNQSSNIYRNHPKRKV